jgi:F0F1-type ATP synthase membrane subunit b/b'|tara:strand:+ start:291 stop:953 length:663 start_codon:yes stop_codon:yes gene_type:complete
MSFITNRNFVVGTVLFLIVTLSAVEILVYNEEILLLVCFSLFIIVAYRSLNEMVASELDDRASKIKSELDSFSTIRKETLESLLEKQKERKHLSSTITDILSFSKKEAEILVVLNSKSLDDSLGQQMKQKLSTLKLSEENVSKAVYREAIIALKSKLSSSSDISLSPYQENSLIKENISMLRLLGKYDFSKTAASSKTTSDVLVLSKVTNLPASLIAISL